MYIIPAIYPEMFEEIADKLYLISDLTHFAQIVLCDGSYGLRKSWLPTGKEILPSTFDYQFDCLLTSWREYLAKAYQMGVKNVVIHVDEFTDEEYDELFRLVNAYTITLGVTVSNDVSVDVLIHAINKAKDSQLFQDITKIFIQVTGARNVDEKNHPFDERVIPRIRILKKLFPSHQIQVGGRINPETARLVKEAGADRLIAGSYLFGHEDLEEALKSIIKAITEETPKPPQEEPKPAAVPVKKEEPKQATPHIETKEEKAVREAYEASKEEIVYDFDEDPFK